MRKKIIINVSVVVVLLGIIIGSIFLFKNLKPKTEHPKAYIYLKNEEVMVIDYLALDSEKIFELKAESEYDSNHEHTILIGASNIGVWIGENDCRDQVCVNTGVINQDSIKPIVCMVYALTIEIK